MTSISFAGINGERADAIKRVLADSGALDPYDIVEASRRRGDGSLWRTMCWTETCQDVLRDLERRGEVERERRHGFDAWRLRVPVATGSSEEQPS